MANGSDACANCQRCSRSAATAGVTALGRGTLHLVTFGGSLAVSGMRRKCGVCAHQRSEHWAELVANVGAPMTQSQAPQDLAWQAGQQRHMAMSQWQAQQVQLAQLAELTNQGQAARFVEEPQNQIAPPAQPATGAGDIVELLTRLAALRDQGILTDDEFAAEKAKVLGGGTA